MRRESFLIVCFLSSFRCVYQLAAEGWISKTKALFIKKTKKLLGVELKNGPEQTSSVVSSGVEQLSIPPGCGGFDRH